MPSIRLICQDNLRCFQSKDCDITGVRTSGSFPPGSCLIGAILLIVADAIGKTVILPYILPVGIVTSFIGAPFFICLIITKRGDFW
ncbi:MAG: iron chelate uptake ABC transporter family permease subunit [Desulfobacteraceae bacterium]|nr:iron chelate uptake ABC transporter family permease subunit [Desulfobacteraceae bacterium]